MRNASASVAALALLAFVVACDYDPRGRCTSQADCLAGQVCSGGVCAAEGAAPVNQPPVAVADAYSVKAGAILSVPAASGVLANDSDPDGDPLTAEKASEPTYGTVFLAPDGSIVYVPPGGFTGTDGFTYRASDGVLRSDATAVTVTVVP
jgi:Bacterial Ig domain